MCMQCEAYGVPAVTVGIRSFATRDEALKYAIAKEHMYNTTKMLMVLHGVGILDLNADAFLWRTA